MSEEHPVLKELEETLAKHRAEMRELVARFGELAQRTEQHVDRSRRERLAGLAMIGILARSGENTAEYVAERAYRQADAMLEQSALRVDPESERMVPGTFAETIFASGAIPAPDDDEPSIGDEMVPS
jgi:hypothetical protein